MPAYEICYKDDSGNLARAFSVKFDSELRAKILAHAMKPQDCRQLEVWDGDRLIYGIVMFLSFALARRATIVSMPRFDLEQYLEMLQRYGVTYLHLVPPIVIALAKHPLVDWHS